MPHDPMGSKQGAETRMAGKRRCRRGLLTLVVALAALAVPTVPASAHEQLVDSYPRPGQRLEDAPRQVTLMFDQPTRGDLTTVRIVGPGNRVVSVGTAQTQGTVVGQQLRSGTGPGTYSIAFRTVSTDGHPVQGALSFRVGCDGCADSPTDSPTDTATDAAAVTALSQAPDPQGGGSAPLRLGALALAVTGLAAAGGLARARQRHEGALG
ncbi:MAG: copper transport protein [Actinomycetota bacterium]|nr:copper transport protein [Actinomycetota bacterium]